MSTLSQEITGCWIYQTHIHIPRKLVLILVPIALPAMPQSLLAVPKRRNVCLGVLVTPVVAIDICILDRIQLLDEDVPFVNSLLVPIASRKAEELRG
jgi:hypothetical protein